MTVGMPVPTRWPPQHEGCFSPDLQEAYDALKEPTARGHDALRSFIEPLSESASQFPVD